LILRKRKSYFGCDCGEDARFLVETRDPNHATIMPQWHGEVGPP
jgi:hypothetical protein